MTGHYPSFTINPQDEQYDLPGRKDIANAADFNNHDREIYAHQELLKNHEGRIVSIEGYIGTGITLDKLSDVVISGALAGDILKWNGTNWVNSQEVDFLSWSLAASQIGITGNKSGSFNLSTTGTITGSSIYVGLSPVLTAETDPVFLAWKLATPPLYSETDPLSVHINQAIPQTIINGIPLLTGLTPTTDYQIATKKYVDDQLSGENLWDRSGTVLTTHTAGDSISLTGSVTASSYYGDGSHLTGVISSHAALTNLDYASAGHTGFQPSGNYLTSESDTLQSVTNRGNSTTNTLVVNASGIFQNVSTLSVEASGNVDAVSFSGDGRNIDNVLKEAILFNLDTEILTLPTSLIHSFIKVDNALFCGSRTNPPTITRVNDCNNMVAGGTFQITLTGRTYCESVTYSETRKKLYFLLVNEVLELDPITMAYTIYALPMTDGTGGSGAITTDGTYFYVTNYVLYSRVAKFAFNGVAFSNLGETTILQSSFNVGWGHSAQFDKDSGFLFVCGGDSPGWMAKINVNTFAYSLIRLPGGYEVISDDIAVAPDYVYGVLEGPTHYRIIRAKKSDWSYIMIDPGINASGFGCIYNPHNKRVYVVYDTTPGSYLSLDQISGEMRLYTAPTGVNSLNELQCDAYQMFYTTWTSPAKVIRVSNPHERYVRLLKEDSTVGYSYNEGAVTADSFYGSASGLYNIAVGNDTEIQYKNGSSLDSSTKLKYDDTVDGFTEGNLKYLIAGAKVGVYKYV